ncbi:MAG: msrA [Xanthomonadaceae bacterium]|nr:msrA [Xanthomonadaceae bacterium]
MHKDNTAHSFCRQAIAMAIVAGFLAWHPATAGDAASILPAPIVKGPPNTERDQSAYFAGGCFWGVEGVFEHVRGVKQATSGFAVDGVETVKVVFDPYRHDTEGASRTRSPPRVAMPGSRPKEHDLAAANGRCGGVA